MDSSEKSDLTRCINCKEAHANHADDKCLFGPTTFEATLCKGCGRSISKEEPRTYSGKGNFSGLYHHHCYLTSDDFKRRVQEQWGL